MSPTARPTHVHRRLRWVLVGLLVLGGWLLSATPASAHAVLETSTPTAGERLETAPSEVVLRFSEPVVLTTQGVAVYDNAGTRVDVGSGTNPTDDAEVTATLQAGLPEGGYVVSYRVISADTHPITGAFTFTVGNGVAPDPNTVGGGDDAVVGFAVDANRWLGYAGLALFAGGLGYVALCWREGNHDPRIDRLVGTGWVVASLSTVFGLLLYGPYSQGQGILGMFDPQLLRVSLGESYGRATLARLLLLFVLESAGVWALRSNKRAAWITAASSFALVLLTFGLGGHPATGIQPVVAVGSDALHLGAMCLWLGGLTVLLWRVLRPGGPADERVVTASVPRFSRLALVCVAVLAVTGTYQAWRGVGSLGALTGTEYGRLVIAKVVGLVVLVGLGLLARRWVARRRAAPATAGVAVLRRSVMVEAGVAVVVLGLAAVLVGTPPGRSTYVAPYDADLALPAGGTVTVHLEPARSGSNILDLTVRDADGQQREVPEVRASLLLPASGDVPEVGPVRIVLRTVAPGQYRADSLSIPSPGDWRLTVDVRTSDFDTSAAVTTIPMS